MKRERPLSASRWLASMLVDVQFAWIATVGAYFSPDTLSNPTPQEKRLIQRFAPRKIDLLIFEAVRGRRAKRRRMSAGDLVEELGQVERVPCNSIPTLVRFAEAALSNAETERGLYERSRTHAARKKTRGAKRVKNKGCQ